MEQILLAYGIPKETVAAITILYRNTKVKVRSPETITNDIYIYIYSLRSVLTRISFLIFNFLITFLKDSWNAIKILNR